MPQIYSGVTFLLGEMSLHPPHTSPGLLLSAGPPKPVGRAAVPCEGLFDGGGPLLV